MGVDKGCSLGLHRGGLLEELSLYQHYNTTIPLQPYNKIQFITKKYKKIQKNKIKYIKMQFNIIQYKYEGYDSGNNPVEFRGHIPLSPPYNNHHTTTTIQQPPHNNHHTTTTIQQPPYNNHHTITTIQQPPYKNHHQILKFCQI